MNYKKVVVAGGGVLGSQIAFQSAYSGFDVTILTHDENTIPEINTKINNLIKTYIDAINLMDKDKSETSKNWCRGLSSVEDFDKDKCIEKVNNINIKITTSQEEALKDADLLIESITELFDVKASFYEGISTKLEEKTVVVTNSSTLLPSKLAKYTKRPNKYLAMHFANTIWKNNVAEIMKHEDTDPVYFDEIIEFAKAIRMIPLAVRNEKSGYLLNSLLVPFLLSAMDMLANDISDPETIDKAWTIGTGAPFGPFQILDTVGLETAKNIVLQYQKVPDLFDPLFKKMMLPYNFDGMLDIINKYMDEGKTGKAAGEGFYKYNK